MNIGYDILAGSIIGIVFAFATYRAYYQAIFDSRYNHIPLVDPDEDHPAPVVADPNTGSPRDLDYVAQPTGPASV